MGFGWSFYGFFVMAALVVGGYFLWARFVNSSQDRSDPAADPGRSAVTSEPDPS